MPLSHSPAVARRDKRERAFLLKLSPGVIRLRFTKTDELLRSLTESLDKYLADNKVAYSGFTYEEEPVGRWEDLDEDKIRIGLLCPSRHNP